MKKLLLLGLACLLAGCIKRDPATSQTYVHEGRTLADWLRAVKDPNSNVRLSAYESLKTLGPEDREAVPALAQALQDPDPNVRWVAADCLGRLGASAKEATDSLSRAQTDKEPRVQRAAIKALSQIYRAQARSVLPGK